MSDFKNFNQCLENSSDLDDIFLFLFAFNICLCNLFKEIIGDSLLDDIRSSEKLTKQYCTVVSQLSCAIEVFSADVDDSLHQDFVRISLLF